MNRVINDPDHVVEDMLTGIVAAHPELILDADNPRVIGTRQPVPDGRVGVVSGGGSGHEPAFLGYVGPGLLDAVAVGEIFSSPTAKSFAGAIERADAGAGVAVLYGNYAGDNMNVKMATKKAGKKGIEVQTVVANDDVASASKDERAKRRGVAGEILMWKAGGARAALGGSLDEVIAAAQQALDATRSVGIGLTPCTIPANGKPNFDIPDGQMEVGIGHHGEHGVRVADTVSAKEMATQMLDIILPDFPLEGGEEVAVLISGLGATPLMEQYILYGEVAAQLAARNIKIGLNFVGDLFTSLEMMGVTLTITKLDDELKTLLTYPCNSMGLTLEAVDE